MYAVLSVLSDPYLVPESGLEERWDIPCSPNSMHILQKYQL